MIHAANMPAPFAFPMYHQRPRPYALRGLGSGYQTAAQVTQIGGAVAGAVVTATTATGTAATVAGAGAATAISTTAAIAVPLIGAAVLAVTLVLASIARRNAQKEAATSIVDQVEPQLRANRDGYLSGPRTRASQQQAIANFYTGWQLVLDNCGRKDLGSAGERCISERSPGGVHPWHEWYLAPIANDTPIENPIANAASELFPTLSAAQAQQLPTYAALIAIALGVALL